MRELLVRPTRAHWFETYVPRAETVFALEILAATGVVELESDAELAHPLDLHNVRAAVAEFEELRARHEDLLPAATVAPAGLVEPPEEMAAAALKRLRPAFERLDELVAKKRGLEDERRNLSLLHECLRAFHGESSILSGLSRQSGLLYKRVFACPRQHRPRPAIPAALSESVSGVDHDFIVVADLPDKAAEIDAAYRSEACQWIDVPNWLSPDAEQQQRRVNACSAEIASVIGRVSRELEARCQAPEFVAALADMAMLKWFAERAAAMSEARRLCHVTGWTTADRVAELQRAFERAHIHAEIRFARPPVFSTAPVSMRLPPWARPFRFFVNMLGAPGRAEIDPSNLLPIIVPLLFGYMFPDVGHGLLLALFSGLLYRRWPEGRFLVPCGLSAALFGVVFGELFGLEGALRPLWIEPMAQPLWVLAAPLVLGAGLLLLGLVFNGVEAHWRGELGAWLRRDAAVLMLYASALTSIFCSVCLWGVLLALLWFVLGHVLAAKKDRLMRIASGLGLLLEGALGLFLNTISFIRVGAFALAHAALSEAVLHLVAGIQNPAMHLVLLSLAHLVIIAVEGLLVFVQTTRLVLFEFFTRFLRAGGRAFRPLSMPPG